MLGVLEPLVLALCALALAPALAHALERPGKARLSEAQYRVVQRIYYPGFTLLGFVEPVAIIGVVALLVATPPGTRFWLVACALVALVALVAMHTVYWVVTHPVNKAWLSDENRGSAGTAFFDAGSADAPRGDWTALRDRWERSHTVRSVLAGAAFLALAVAVSLD